MSAFDPSSFTRRQVLQGTVMLAASSLLPGCTKGNGLDSGSAITPNPQSIPTGTITPGTVMVTSSAAGSIGSAFVGLSYEKSFIYDFKIANTNMMGMFQRLGPSLLRIAGNSVNTTVYNPTGKGGTPGQVAPIDIATLAAFINAIGWQCLYGVNCGPTSTPALAAEEVAVAVQAFGSSLLGIEIGNEPDLYGVTGGPYAGNWSLGQFETLWESYRSAIVASSPSVNITGPADSSNVATWTVPFGQYATKSQISLLTQHYYRGDGQSASSTPQFLVSYPDTQLTGKWLSLLQPAATSLGIPYRMSECNSFYNGGASGVSDCYASALWVIDYLFTLAQYGCAGANLHGGGDGGSYTPIADASGVVLGARPIYYGMLLFTLAGTGTLQSTTVSAGSLNVTAYAVLNAGTTNVVIVNKDPTNSMQMTVTLPQAISSATLQQMTQLSAGATGPSLTAVPTSTLGGDQSAGVTIQGAEVSTGGNFAPAAPYTLMTSNSTVTCYVPALSAVLIRCI